MTVSNIKKSLKNSLIKEGEMDYGLYEYELEELLDELKLSLAEDKDEFIFAVTENSNYVAMVLVEKSGKIYINESARDRLKELWRGAYLSNMKKLIPMFARQLNDGSIPINGVKNIGK